MSYVPPHLRKRTAGNDNPETSPISPSAPTPQKSGRQWTTQKFYTLDDLVVHTGTRHNTLLPDPSCPTRLLAIMLFKDQHPDWTTKRQIFVKSNLDLLNQFRPEDWKQVCALDRHVVVDTSSEVQKEPAAVDEATVVQGPGDSESTDKSAPQSIPLFVEIPFGKTRNTFEFEGYWHILSVQWLQPHSPELITQLERKFNPTSPTKPKRSFGRKAEHRPVERTEKAWKDSLEREWAVVTLEKDLSRLDPPF